MVSHVDSFAAVKDSKKPSQQVSLPIVLGLSRALDMVIIGALGVVSTHVLVLENGIANSDDYFLAILLALFIAAIAFRNFDAYNKRRLFSSTDAVRPLVYAWATTIGFLLLIAFGLKTSDLYSRIWFATWIASVTGALVLHRLVLVGLVAHWAKQGLLRARTVIIGAGPHGSRLAQHIRDHGNINTRVMGFIDERGSRSPGMLEGYPLLGDLDVLERMVRNHEVDEVVIALPWEAEERLHAVTHRLSLLPVQVRMAPDFTGFDHAGGRYSFLAGVPMLNVFDRPISGWSSVVKTLEDRVAAPLLVLLALPVMALVALLIKLDSPGPVFFRQQRHGFNNNLIGVYKFRTMYVDQTDATARKLATRDDPRVTRIGRILRATSLDELPQLLNVLHGEMSLVGPPPHAVHAGVGERTYWDIVDDYAARHKVKPGITGWAQVNGWRGETDTDEKIRKRVEHDLYYIENWSLWLDIKIVLKTALVVLSRQNAY